MKTSTQIRSVAQMAIVPAYARDSQPFLAPTIESGLPMSRLTSSDAESLVYAAGYSICGKPGAWYALPPSDVCISNAYQPAPVSPVIPDLQMFPTREALLVEIGSQIAEETRAFHRMPEKDWMVLRIDVRCALVREFSLRSLLRRPPATPSKLI